MFYLSVFFFGRTAAICCDRKIICIYAAVGFLQVHFEKSLNTVLLVLLYLIFHIKNA